MTLNSIPKNYLATLARHFEIPIIPDVEMTFDGLKGELLKREALENQDGFTYYSYERMGKPCLLAMYDIRRRQRFHEWLRSMFPSGPRAILKEARGTGEDVQKAKISLHELACGATVRLLESVNRSTTHGIDRLRLPWKAKDGGFEEWLKKYVITIHGEGQESELARKILHAGFVFSGLSKADRSDYAPPLDHNQKTGKRFLLFLGGVYSGSPTEITFIGHTGQKPKFLHQVPVDEDFRRPAEHRGELPLASGPRAKYRFYLSRDAGSRDGATIPANLPTEIKSLLREAETAGVQLKAKQTAKPD